MESQEKNGMEPQEIDIVELGSASELIQENAPTRPAEKSPALPDTTGSRCIFSRTRKSNILPAIRR